MLLRKDLMNRTLKGTAVHRASACHVNAIREHSRTRGSGVQPQFADGLAWFKLRFMKPPQDLPFEQFNGVLPQALLELRVSHFDKIVIRSHLTTLESH